MTHPITTTPPRVAEIAPPASIGFAIVGSAAAPGARGRVAALGVDDRVAVAASDPTCDTLPPTDWYVLADGLRHVPAEDRRAVLANVRRALPPDGMMLVVDPLMGLEEYGGVCDELEVLEPLIGGAPHPDNTAADFDACCLAAGYDHTEVVVMSGVTVAVAHVAPPL